MWKNRAKIYACGKSIEVKYKYIKIVRRNGISKFVWEKGQFYK